MTTKIDGMKNSIIGTVRRGGKAADAQAQRQQKCQRAIAADAAVLHDLELAVPRRATAEAVGHIGQTVFVQGSGGQRARGQRKQRGHQRGQSLGRPEDQRRRQKNVPIEERLLEAIAWSATLLADSLRRGELRERPLPTGLGSLVR